MQSHVYVIEQLKFLESLEIPSLFEHLSARMLSLSYTLCKVLICISDRVTSLPDQVPGGCGAVTGPGAHQAGLSEHAARRAAYADH